MSNSQIIRNNFLANSQQVNAKNIHTEDSFSFEVKRTMDEQDGGRKVPTVASGDMFETRTEAGGTADPRIAAIAKMETKTESDSTTQVTVAAEPTAATTSAPSDTAGVPWVLASHPVFKQYGKLAVGVVACFASSP